MRIIVDVMGGDKAPLENLCGVLSAVSECDAKFTLVGDLDEMRRIAKKKIGLNLDQFEAVRILQKYDQQILGGSVS